MVTMLDLLSLRPYGWDVYDATVEDFGMAWEIEEGVIDPFTTMQRWIASKTVCASIGSRDGCTADISGLVRANRRLFEEMCEVFGFEPPVDEDGDTEMGVFLVQMLMGGSVREDAVEWLADRVGARRWTPRRSPTSSPVADGLMPQSATTTRQGVPPSSPPSPARGGFSVSPRRWAWTGASTATSRGWSRSTESDQTPPKGSCAARPPLPHRDPVRIRSLRIHFSDSIINHESDVLFSSETLRGDARHER